MEPMLQPQVVMGSYQIEADRTRLGNEYLQVGFHPQMGGKKTISESVYQSLCVQTAQLFTMRFHSCLDSIHVCLVF